MTSENPRSRRNGWSNITSCPILRRQAAFLRRKSKSGTTLNLSGSMCCCKNVGEMAPSVLVERRQCPEIQGHVVGRKRREFGNRVAEFFGLGRRDLFGGDH